MTMAPRSRPTGVTILGALYIIGGLIATAGALLAGVAASALAGIPFGTAIGGLLAMFFGIIALIEFVIAAGLLSGRSWGRKVVIVLSIIDLILEAVTLLGGNIFAIAFIILDIIVLYYMWRPHVKAYFEGASYKPAQAQATGQKAGNCPQCGNPVAAHSNFCEKCGSKLKVCTHCFNINANESTFCSKCGSSI